MTAATCTHLDAITEVEPRSGGCEECVEHRHGWVHLRLCMSCGHIGCCDSSPGKHATGHWLAEQHPIIRSFEPGEDWWWCYPDELAFEVPGAPPAPSHD